MPPVVIDPRTVEDLKNEATARAEGLGHHLQPFRTAKRDQLCHVSFCRDCRQMVVVSFEDAEPRLFGYALEVRCSGAAAAVHERPVAAGAP